MIMNALIYEHLLDLDPKAYNEFRRLNSRKFRVTELSVRSEAKRSRGGEGPI